MTMVPKSLQPAARSCSTDVYDQPDTAAAKAQFDHLLDYTEQTCPRPPTTLTPHEPIYRPTATFPVKA